MPFSDTGGQVAEWFEGFWERCFGERELLFKGYGEEFGGGPLAPAGNPIGQMEPGGVTAGHQRRPCRRANRAGGVGLREFHTFRSQTVQLRCLMEWMAITAPVAPAEIVDQDDNEIGLALHLTEVEAGAESSGQKSAAGGFIRLRHRTGTRQSYVRINVEGNCDAE
jgi:hypothetical protein